MTCLRSQRGARLEPLDDRVAWGGDGDPDQPVAAPGDVVGVAGQVVDEQVALPRPRAREPVAYDGARAALGHRDERLVGRQGDAVGEGEPVEHDRDRAVGVAAQQPAGAGVLDEVVLPLLDAVAGRGVAEPDRAVARDRRVVAEQHRARRRHRVSSVSTCVGPSAVTVHDAAGPRCGVADEQVARRRRARCRAVGRRCGRPGRCGGRRGVSRKIVPSSVPVKTRPSGRATTTSSAPGPGTGWTVKVMGLLRLGVASAESRKAGTMSAAALVRSRPARLAPGRRRRSGGPRGTRCRRR